MITELRNCLSQRPLYWRPAWTYPRRDMRRFMRRPFYIDLKWIIEAEVWGWFGYCRQCGRKGFHKFDCGLR